MITAAVYDVPPPIVVYDPSTSTTTATTPPPSDVVSPASTTLPEGTTSVLVPVTSSASPSRDPNAPDLNPTVGVTVQKMPAPAPPPASMDNGIAGPPALVAPEVQPQAPAYVVHEGEVLQQPSYATPPPPPPPAP